MGAEEMTPNTKGWLGFVGALGMMAVSLSPEVESLASWATVTSPAFVGKLLFHFGSVVMAFYAGKGIPVGVKSE